MKSSNGNQDCRSSIVKIRVTQEQYTKLRDYAYSKKTTMSNILRSYINRLPHKNSNK